MWLEFVQEAAPPANRTWARRDYTGNVEWFAAPAPPGSPVSLHIWNGQPLVLSADGRGIGRLQHPLNSNRRGLLRATVALNPAQLELSYLGPDDLWAVA